MTPPDEIWFTSAGRRLFTTSCGQGPVVMVLHTLVGTAENALPWQQALSDRYTVVAPDARGRGRSTPARTDEEHTWRQYGADVHALLDHLGAERAILCGASMGAGVAVAAALQEPRRFDGLVLLGSAYAGEAAGWLPGQEPLLEILRLHELADDGGWERAVDLTLGPMPGSDEHRAQHRSLWLQHDEASMRAALRGVGLRQPFEDLEELRAITAPVLLVPGADEAHPRLVSERYAEVLPNAWIEDLMRDGVDVARLVEATGRFADARYGQSRVVG